MKKLLVLAFILLIPTVALAETSAIDLPHWSFEFKGGLFTPALSNWSNFYGKKDMPIYGLSLAYKVTRQLEIGFEGEYSRATGKAFAPLHSQLLGYPVYGGKVTYEIFPANVFVLYRGVFNEEQWLVPYVGGGYTKLFYREETERQSTVKGSADGYHVRGGLQFLLDAVDPDAANNMARDYGVEHTYFFLEAEYMKAKVQSFDLGGTSYLAGFLFEF